MATAVLVAGSDYFHPAKGAGVSFKQLAEHRRDVLVAADPAIEVTIFDLRAGTVTTSKPAASGKGRTEVAGPTFKEVTPANYTTAGHRHPHFDKSPAGVMSITDVYSHVRAIGADPARTATVSELSFFSHAYLEGPILLNSDEAPGTGVGRDPDDKDARTKDFNGTNMPPATLREFRAAFAATAFCWVWGCDFSVDPLQVMAQFHRSPAFRGSVPNKIPDSAEVQFEFTSDQAEEFYPHNTTFFPQTKAIPRKGKTPKFSELKFKRTVKDIKAYFRAEMDRTYLHALAVGSARTTFGAFPGTYTDYEEADRKRKHPLMLVPRGKPWGDDFSASIAFFRDGMGIAEDPTGRGYATYSP